MKHKMGATLLFPSEELLVLSDSSRAEKEVRNGLPDWGFGV
jgi:hypothetical protein